MDRKEIDVRVLTGLVAFFGTSKYFSRKTEPRIVVNATVHNKLRWCEGKTVFLYIYLSLALYNSVAVQM